MEMRYKNTVAKIQHLKSLPKGYNVVEMWSCKFREFCILNPAAGNFVRNLQLEEPLHIRDAFFGGRTEMFWKYKCCESENVIKYYDVCSLYPYICKYGIFPIGHPKIFREEEAMPSSLDGLVGFAKISILPPRKLLFPVLPVKSNGKLFFGLCRTCIEECSENSCTHTDEERVIKGTFALCELQKAVELGYTIVKIYEIWSYESTQFDVQTRNGGLFAEYINTFLKLKQEASGFPSRVQTEEQIREYIREMEERENITLDRENIIHNPGLRSLAKLALNSLW